jgi:hypothetical protein
VPLDWLQVDEGGYFGLRREHDSPEASLKVYGWMLDCCELPEMEAASERIANWPGYRFLQQALARVGWAQFPVLRQELPESNGGLTDASAAEAALGELERFRRVGEMAAKTCLVDVATGEVVRDYIGAYGGVFIMDGRAGLDAGFDGSGFFIRHRGTAEELFRAARLRQTLLDPHAYMHGPEPGQVIFLDLDSGRTLECRTAVPGKEIPWPDGRMQDDQGRCNFEDPAELHVEHRPERSSDYEYILGPLETVFQASVETGNPVRWE